VVVLCFRDISSTCWRIFAKLLSLVHLGTQMTWLLFGSKGQSSRSHRRVQLFLVVLGLAQSHTLVLGLVLKFCHCKLIQITITHCWKLTGWTAKGRWNSANKYHCCVCIDLLTVLLRSWIRSWVLGLRLDILSFTSLKCWWLCDVP